MKRIFLFAFLLSAFSASIISCRQDKAQPDTTFTDAKFFNLILDTAGHSLYKDGSGVSQFTSTQAAHSNAFYELRMNKKAFDACTAGGKLPMGGTFPDSSLIIKQLRTASSGPVTLYAAIYKLGGAWNWAEYKTNGDVIFSIKGDAQANCVSCHNFNARDLVRTFDEHP